MPDFFKTDRNQFRYTFFFHGDPVNCLAGGHGVLVVRNNNELGVILKFFQEFNESADISVVKWGVNFVKNTEWAGFDEIDGKKQGEGGEGFFTSAELFDGEGLFSFGLGDYFNMCFKWVVGGVDEEVGLIFGVEEFLKNCGEVFPHGLKCCFKFLQGGPVDLFYCFEKLCFGGVEVVFCSVRKSSRSFSA